MFDVVIRGGQVVTGQGVQRADIGIAGERIEALAPEISGQMCIRDRSGIHAGTGDRRRGCRAPFGRFDGDGKKPQAFNLHQGRAPVCDIQDAGNRLAIAAPRFILELGHNSIKQPPLFPILNPLQWKSCKPN